MNKINIEVKDLTTGEIVKRFDFDLTALSSLFNNDIQKTKQAYIEEMKKKYPPYKYLIIEISAPADSSIETSGTFRMEASAKSLKFVNCSAVFFGVILVFLLLFFRHIYTFGVFLFAICVILILMIGDYLVWKKKGIRVIEIDDNGINLYRGPTKLLERIEASQITDINIFKKVNRRIVTILTGGQTYRAPGVTLFKGSRIRIADDSFDDKQFTIFVEKIKQFKNIKDM
jgi:hypothetical protein